MNERTQEIKETLPPFHVLKDEERFYVYGVALGVFFAVNEPSFDLLNLCLLYPWEEAASRFERQTRWPAATRRRVFQEVRAMLDNGLGNIPDSILPEDDYERIVARRYAGPWNKIELSLSEGCNLACKYCYCATSRDMPSQGLMSEQVARQAITWLFAMSGKSEQVGITFFGGEPLLNKPVLRFSIRYSQYLARLHGKKVFYSMTTNGTLLDDEVIGYIKRYNFGLIVSLDGPKEIHDRQCPTQGGKGSYDLAVAGIKRLMARRRRVTVRGTMTHPLPNMLRLIQFYEKFGFTRAVLGKATNPVRPSGVDCEESDMRSYFRQQRAELIPWMLEELRQGRQPIYYPYRSFVETVERGEAAPPFRCAAELATAP